MEDKTKKTPATTAARAPSTAPARSSWITSTNPESVAFRMPGYYGGANPDILGTKHNDQHSRQDRVDDGRRANLEHMLYRPVGFPVDYVHARPAVKVVPQYKQGTKAITTRDLVQQSEQLGVRSDAGSPRPVGQLVKAPGGPPAAAAPEQQQPNATNDRQSTGSWPDQVSNQPAYPFGRISGDEHWRQATLGPVTSSLSHQRSRDVTSTGTGVGTYPPITTISSTIRRNPNQQAAKPLGQPDGGNTAIWITHLPADCTYPMLLGAIKNCGKVYTSHINLPHGPYSTSAANVILFTQRGAARLLEAARAGRFVVGGYCVPRVQYNHRRMAPQPPGPQTRVLIIEGPAYLVEEQALRRFFGNKFAFSTEQVSTVWATPDRVRVEWRFVGYRSHSQSAICAIRDMQSRSSHLSHNEREAWREVAVWYEADPCGDD